MYNLPLACIGKSTGGKIGSFVRIVEEVDVQEEATGWGEYLRVKVSIELSKPLARGRMLHIPGRSIWVAFKYEKLPKFYYACGIIHHWRQGCSGQGKGKQNAEEEENQYGSWLQVAFPPRRSTGGDKRYGGRSFVGNQIWRPKQTPPVLSALASEVLGSRRRDRTAVRTCKFETLVRRWISPVWKQIRRYGQKYRLERCP
jgi:hypothetical protein